MDVVVLECIVGDAADDLVAVVVAARAAGAAGADLGAEQLPTAGDLRGLGRRRELRARVGHPPGLVLGPQDLVERHLVEVDRASVARQLGAVDRGGVGGGLVLDEGVARGQSVGQVGLREQGRLALGVDQLAVARRRVGRHVVVEALEPLRPVVGQVLVLRHR
ncbi:MAG TPA: hypothetical protein VFF36_01345, partial [Planctomycetota bacterium]|nr:hypothetical protein [Planctomycetota bacterium]